MKWMGFFGFLGFSLISNQLYLDNLKNKQDNSSNEVEKEYFSNIIKKVQTDSNRNTIPVILIPTAMIIFLILKKKYPLKVKVKVKYIFLGYQPKQYACSQK